MPTRFSPPRRRPVREAIHPGYGFLSENAGFAEAVQRHGHRLHRTDSGTDARVRAEAHRAAHCRARTACRCLPGTGLLADRCRKRCRRPQRIGYPVMLKSTAGGGGIGMRLCAESPRNSPNAFAAVERLEPVRASATAGLYLEKFVTRARHIEVQIFGDGTGRGGRAGRTRLLGAATQSESDRGDARARTDGRKSARSLLEAAVRLGEAVSYRSAGTVEFIYDDDTAMFYFLEVNTRLQVEHGVTEEVTGVDLVEWMVRLAAGGEECDGRPLPRADGPARRSGWSMQVRIYAEDPAKNFQPCAGRLVAGGVAGATPGSKRGWSRARKSRRITIRCWRRSSCAGTIARQRSRNAGGALANAASQGIETNLDYLRQVLRRPDFRSGRHYDLVSARL